MRGSKGRSPDGPLLPRRSSRESGTWPRTPRTDDWCLLGLDRTSHDLRGPCLLDVMGCMPSTRPFCIVCRRSICAFKQLVPVQSAVRKKPLGYLGKVRSTCCHLEACETYSDRWCDALGKPRKFSLARVVGSLAGYPVDSLTVREVAR